MQAKDFVNKFYSHAAAISTKELPPAFILAHAFLESGKGESLLTKKANNFFGVKATGNNPSITLTTREIINGIPVSIPQKFAVYNSPMDAFKAYAKLLSNNRYKSVLQSKTNKQRAQNLKNSGYFTAGQNYVNALANTADQFQKLIRTRPNNLIMVPIIALLFFTTYLASKE